MKGPGSGKVNPYAGGLALLVVVAAGLLLDQEYGETLRSWSETRVPRDVQGEIFGAMPAPTAPSLQDEVVQALQPQAKQPVRMVVRRLPVIDLSTKLPHPYWGTCRTCHLVRGGAPAGTQPITPFGKVAEKISTIYKVGPPIFPDSTRHHPEAGRCIKCHDLVVVIP
ncbi:MAG: magnetochrome domain-containing protein [Magnetococcus sp. WYHC-3]